MARSRDDHLWALAHAERTALSEDLSGLNAEQWRNGTLCRQWDVEEVVAHLTAAASLNQWRWVRSMLGAPTYAAMEEPSVVDPVVDLLAQLVGDGAALEFAVGTGRIALPLSARGVPVHGIELSPEMVEQFRRKRGADAVPVTIGDMARLACPAVSISSTWSPTRS